MNWCTEAVGGVNRAPDEEILESSQPPEHFRMS